MRQHRKATTAKDGTQIASMWRQRDLRFLSGQRHPQMICDGNISTNLLVRNTRSSSTNHRDIGVLSTGPEPKPRPVAYAKSDRRRGEKKRTFRRALLLTTIAASHCPSIPPLIMSSLPSSVKPRHAKFQPKLGVASRAISSLGGRMVITSERGVLGPSFPCREWHPFERNEGSRNGVNSKG